MWDQLRNTMKDETRNPFSGFQEHIIDFPPTFKYDVSEDFEGECVVCANDWHRSGIRSRRSTKKHVRLYDERAPTPADSASNPIQFRPMAFLPPHLSPKTCLSSPKRIQTKNTTVMLQRIVGHSRAVLSMRPMMMEGRSSRVDRSSRPRATLPFPRPQEPTCQITSPLYHTNVDASAYGSKQKAFEVALKNKTKRLLGLVKMDGIFSSSSGKRRALAKGSAQLKVLDKGEQRMSAEFVATSRRTSLSSIATTMTHDYRSEGPIDDETPTTARQHYSPPSAIGQKSGLDA